MLVYTDKPGDMLDVIERAAPGGIERRGWEEDNAELDRSDDPLDLARSCPTPQMMEEQYLAACSLVRDGFGEPAWMNYAKALSPSAVRLTPGPAAVSRYRGQADADAEYEQLAAGSVFQMSASALFPVRS